MDFEEKFKEIRLLIAEEKLEEAISELDIIISQDANQDTAFYLKGNVYRKKQDWRLAINNYTYALEINPESPASAARTMCVEILNFYDTTMYNH